MHTEISSETHRSVNTDDNHNTCDTDDEDPQPAKQRKSRSAPASTPPPHLRRSRPLESFSITSLEIDDTQPQADFGCPSTLVDDEHHHTPRTSQSPPASANSEPIAEYQEWPFQGFFKLTKIGNETTYNPEFQLSHIPEHLHLPVLSEALGIPSNRETPAKAAIPHDSGVHSKMYSATVGLEQNVFDGNLKRMRW